VLTEEVFRGLEEFGVGGVGHFLVWYEITTAPPVRYRLPTPQFWGVSSMGYLACPSHSMSSPFAIRISWS
jgi:hypothetical protein